MLGNAQTVGSPDWYLIRLGNALSADLSSLKELHDYDLGDHPMPVGPQYMRETYRRLQKMARSNYCGLISSTVCERLNVTGFFTGSRTDPITDDAAWQVWQANSLDAESGVVHRNAVSLGRAYVCVGAPDPTDTETPDAPVITVESPFQVIHESDPARPRRVRAALKTYFDAVRNRQLAIVYLPGFVAYYQSANTGPDPAEWVPQAWTLDTSEYVNGYAPNLIGVVPIVPFINRRDVSQMGFSEFGDVTDCQDRINTTVMDRLVIQTMQAFRQRWAINIDVEDENGNPLKPFDPGVDLLWTVPPPEDAAVPQVKFGDFEQSDVNGIIASCDADIAIIGTLSRTPPHYLTGQLVNVSGDALTVAESALISKVKSRQVEFGESWERVIRLAGLYTGASIGQDAVISWEDPERYSLTALADAAVKYQSTGVPFRERMALLGFTPSEIDRMEQERIKDSLLESMHNPMGVSPGITVTGSEGILEPNDAAPSPEQPAR